MEQRNGLEESPDDLFLPLEKLVASHLGEVVNLQATIKTIT